MLFDTLKNERDRRRPGGSCVKLVLLLATLGGLVKERVFVVYDLHGLFHDQELVLDHLGPVLDVSNFLQRLN